MLEHTDQKYIVVQWFSCEHWPHSVRKGPHIFTVDGQKTK